MIWQVIAGAWGLSLAIVLLLAERAPVMPELDVDHVEEVHR